MERTRARMEDYWCSRLSGKGMQGAKFALSSCYGWRERREVGVDQPAREAMSAKAVPVDERERLLREAAAQFGQEGVDVER